MKFVKSLSAAAAVAAALAAHPAAAQSWETLGTSQSVVTTASPAKAYAAVAKWEALESWCPAFVKTTIKSGAGVGSVREITLKDGPSFTEELLWADASALSYSYKIVESPLPLIDYRSSIKVSPAEGGGAEITWSGTYRRRAEKPGKDNDDTAVRGIVDGLYKACLANAKAMLDGK
ncbi:MAG: SRPBCC family protein [Burkholderiales bacterium]|jgi:hypothetical protein|nr:SRPBCC family protein [Burkholderiales bacterium]